MKELIAQNEQLAGTAKLAEKSANALSLLQNQITVLEKENAFLRAQIIQFGIDAAASNSQPSNVNRQILNSPLAQSLLNTVAQATQAPPPPPPPPPQNLGGLNTQATAQQLLISLAQSLTNSPLLTTPTAQNQPPLVPNVTSSPSRLVSSASPLTATSTPSRIISSLAPVTPQQPPMLALQPPAAGSNSQLLSSLVQTLASLANTSMSPPISKASPPAPIITTRAQTPPQSMPTSGGGLSAAAAASLLNTLIMAQNVLTSTSGSGGESASVLGSIGLDAVSRGEQ